MFYNRYQAGAVLFTVAAYPRKIIAQGVSDCLTNAFAVKPKQVRSATRRRPSVAAVSDLLAGRAIQLIPAVIAATDCVEKVGFRRTLHAVHG